MKIFYGIINKKSSCGRMDKILCYEQRGYRFKSCQEGLLKIGEKSYEGNRYETK